MSTVAQHFGYDPIDVRTPKGLTAYDGITVDSSELIGIEVEVENLVTVNTLNRIWQQETDGSLRNDGAEYITHPMEARYAPAALNHLLKEHLSEECCFSPRTSIHVHVNVHDISLPKVVDLILMYSIFERLFYRFTGRGRIKNIYCVPLIETDLLAGLAHHGLTENWEKYTGLNARPVFSYGTVEFRHMHGTFDVNKLCIWINIITKLKEYIVATPTKQIRDLIADITEQTDVDRLMRTIFGTYTDHLKYRSYSDIADAVDVVKGAFRDPGVSRNLARTATRTSPFLSTSI